MRDILTTNRTRRYMVGNILTSVATRTQPVLDAVASLVAAGSLATINAATFGLLNGAAASDSCSITATATTLTSSDNPWSAGDVGKTIHIAGAGAAGAVLVTTIASYTSAGQVEIATAASTTVAASATSAAGLAIWGTLPNLPLLASPITDASGAPQQVSGAFTGDSGSGGVAGLVPAPAAGDAALGKVLGADGLWKSPIGAWWGGIVNVTPLDVTVAGAASADRMHIVSGTAADYTITLPAPTAGRLVAFMVKDWTAANKQYTLDAGGAVLVAGRLRYLALTHTNVVLLRGDGTNWLGLVLDLNSPEVDYGAMAVTASTTNPTKNATRDVFFARRINGSMGYRWEYVQPSGGTDGSGTYFLGIPFTASVNVNVSGAGTNAKPRSSIGYGMANNQALIGCLYDTTHIYGNLVQSTTNLFASANLGWSGERYFNLSGVIPILNW